MRVGPRQRQLLELLAEPRRALLHRPGWIGKTGDSYVVVGGDERLDVEIPRRVAQSAIARKWVWAILTRRYLITHAGRAALREAWRAGPIIDQLAELVDE